MSRAEDRRAIAHEATRAHGNIKGFLRWCDRVRHERVAEDEKIARCYQAWLDSHRRRAPGFFDGAYTMFPEPPLERLPDGTLRKWHYDAKQLSFSLV